MLPSETPLKETLRKLGPGSGNKMSTSDIDTISEPEIMTVEEVAQYLRKSTSWVYKNWQALGGRKLGGSLFFGTKGELHEHLFGEWKGLEIRLQPGGNQTHEGLVQTKTGRPKSGHRKKKGTKKSGTVSSDANRHGLLGPCESST